MNIDMLIIELKVMLYRKTLLKYGIYNENRSQKVRVNYGKNRVTVYINNQYVIRYNKKLNELSLNNDNSFNMIDCLQYINDNIVLK